ncbi:MAG: hypothetical protein PHE83_17360 [Opitutaceae bacterium]|nr:hypothetical protein [Opitutaceae bacterium]
MKVAALVCLIVLAGCATAPVKEKLPMGFLPESTSREDLTKGSVVMKDGRWYRETPEETAQREARNQAMLANYEEEQIAALKDSPDKAAVFAKENSYIPDRKSVTDSYGHRLEIWWYDSGLSTRMYTFEDGKLVSQTKVDH